MNNFDYYKPTRFIFGRDTENQVGELVKEYHGTKVLLVYGGGSAVRSGLVGNVQKYLQASGIEYVTLGGVQPNPLDTLVYKGIEICKKENVDFMLAVGGGSVIDTAKAIAIGSKYEGDFWDFYAHKATAKSALPVATISTIAAAGSEGSNSSVITQASTRLKRGVNSEFIIPTFAILNPVLTMTLPEYQTSCGITDMLAHIQERYFTNTKGVTLTDYMCEGSMKAIITEAYKLMENPSDYDARANIMWAGVIAHNNSLGLDRDQDWASHKIEHELSGMFDVAHGAGLAIIFPAWMKYVMHHDLNRFVQYANRVWNVEVDYNDLEMTALKGINQYENFLKDIHMPTRLSDIGVKKEDIDKLIAKYEVGMPKALGGFVKLSVDDIRHIYELAL